MPFTYKSSGPGLTIQSYNTTYPTIAYIGTVTGSSVQITGITGPPNFTYSIVRNGTTIATGQTGTTYTDSTVAGSTTYTYQIVPTNPYSTGIPKTIGTTTTPFYGTTLTKATMNLQNWWTPDNVTLTGGLVTAWPDQMGNYNLSNLFIPSGGANNMTKVIAPGTTSTNAIYQNVPAIAASYLYGGAFSETVYVVVFAAYTISNNGGFSEIFGDKSTIPSIRLITGINSLNNGDLQNGGTSYTNGTAVTPGTTSWGSVNTWNIYCMYITTYRTSITILAILGDYAYNGRNFYGYAGDFFVGNASFGTTEQQKLEGYLGYKYKCQSSLPTNHPFYSATNSNIVMLS
jgi:hypothetical protein